MGTRGKWTKVSDYCITNGIHNICRVVLKGEDTFEVWARKTAGRLKVFKTADEARAWRMENKPVTTKAERDFDALRKALKGQSA